MFIISKEVHQATTYDAAVTNVIHNFKAYKRNEAKKKTIFSGLCEVWKRHCCMAKCSH